jgi:hypothetical protein
VAAGSKLASYGPWLIAQTVTGYLLAIWHDISKQAWHSMDLVWINEVPLGTKVSIVPLGTTYKKLSQGNIGIIYQQYNGNLAAFSSPDDFEMPTMPPKKVIPTPTPATSINTPSPTEVPLIPSEFPSEVLSSNTEIKSTRRQQRRQSSSHSWPPSGTYSFHGYFSYLIRNFRPVP